MIWVLIVAGLVGLWLLIRAAARAGRRYAEADLELLYPDAGVRAADAHALRQRQRRGELDTLRRIRADAATPTPRWLVQRMRDLRRGEGRR